MIKLNTNKYNADIVKTKAWFLKNDNITKAKLQIQMSILVQLRLVPINRGDQADCKDFR